jgi:hypothetical protein
VRRRVTAALIAALALLAWVMTPALAAAPSRRGAARGYAAGATGHPVPAPALTTGRRAEPGTTPAPRQAGITESAVAIGAVVVLLALTIFVTRRRSRAGRSSPERRPPSAPAMYELVAAAANALVTADNAVRTSEQELGFATARCGKRATAPFSAALQSARAELAAAFTLRQRLDDDLPVSDAASHRYLTDISVHCAEANRLLDEQSAAFDRLQDLATRAPGLAAEIEAYIAQQSARVGPACQILDRLRARYTAKAVAVVAANAGDALERLDFAGGSLASARNDLAAGVPGRAAVLLQAAEAGADEAADLLDGVKHMEAELTQAASGLAAALREVDAEIDEAMAVTGGASQAELARVVAEAQAVAADVRARRAAGPFDALGALRDVQQADAALDRALASGREEQARRERARAVLDQAMLVARSSVTAAGDFIATRRGGVGASARTRLAESQRHFQLSVGYAQNDPEAALAEAQHADALARQARTLAEEDVASFDEDELGAVGTIAGVRGAILGGTLIDSLPGGIGPPSFGGAATRGRRSMSPEHGSSPEQSSSPEHGVPVQSGISGPVSR